MSFPPTTVHQPTSQKDYMKVELKVLTAFVTFTFVMALAITNNSVASRTYKEFEQELIDYFTCESTGVSPGKACSRSGFENADYTPFLVAINEIVLTIYPFVSLIYVVNITEIKKALLKCVNSRESSDSNAICGHATSRKPDKDGVTVLTSVDTQANECPTSIEGGGNEIVSTEM